MKRNRFRLARIRNWLKNSIITWAKGDVPTYITRDMMVRLHKGERAIILPMCKQPNHKSIVDYLNEYHNKQDYWTLEFLHVAFEVTEKRIREKLSRFSDISIETLNISDTDRKIIIKFT